MDVSSGFLVTILLLTCVFHGGNARVGYGTIALLSSVNVPSVSLYSGPAAWNSLPPCLQSTTNTSSFKRQLKTHVFTEAF